jgi:hypothetical protein
MDLFSRIFYVSCSSRGATNRNTSHLKALISTYKTKKLYLIKHIKNKGTIYNI